MPLTIRNIIDEADILVPNKYTDDDKFPWLNAINQEFFDVVKIPLTETFTAIPASNEYTLLGYIREKNIDKLTIGNLKYRSFNYEDVQPGQNFFIFYDGNNKLFLSVPPSRSALGFVRYYRIAAQTFGAGNVDVYTPDAPSEYHWIYTLGLAEYIAKANEEDEKAVNYGGQYQKALNAAAQNFWKDEPK